MSPKGVAQSNSFIFAKGKVHAFNGELLCQYPIPALNRLKGAVYSTTLLAVLQHWQDDLLEIVIEKKEDSGRLLLLGDGHRSRILMEFKIENPYDQPRLPKQWEAVPDNFSDALSTVVECTNKDQNKIVTNSVHIHPDYLEATDYYQLARYRLETGITKPCLIRRDSIAPIADVGVTEIGETQNWVSFKNPSGLIMSCRRIVEDYRIGKETIDSILQMPKDGDRIAFPKSAISAIKGALIYATEIKDETDPRSKIVVEVLPGKLRVSAIGVSGMYSERREKNIRYKGPPKTFLVRGEDLIHIIEKYKECVITKSNHLRVEGDKFTYLACMQVPKKEARNGSKKK